jgi:nondiscriminating glutamyl-tRNA synthetase
LGKAVNHRTRFAPSPTGPLHIGGARTALFNWLYAKKTNGSFVLRIEDTDRERSSKVHEERLIDDLAWLGLFFDEGPHIEDTGDFGPYRQSERRAIYKEHIAKLLDGGTAYRCYCTEERLKELREAQKSAGTAPGYDGLCRGLKSAPEGIEPVVRFQVANKPVSFIDGLHGEMSFDATLIGDFIIEDSRGATSFLFASALDDSLMEITEVIRGDDHMSNTPRQILVLEALGLNIPAYTHIPLVLDTDRKPLSKRIESAALSSLKEEGNLAIAILNAAARLGWAPKEQGLMTSAEMTEAFSLKNLSKSAAVFDLSRLKSFNKEALRASEAEALLPMVSPWFKKAEKAWLTLAISFVKDDAESVKDIVRLISPLMGAMTITPEAEALLGTPETSRIVDLLAKEVEGTGELDDNSYKNIINVIKEETGFKGKALFMPIRVALTGCVSGIELNKVMILLGRDNALERIETTRRRRY